MFNKYQAQGNFADAARRDEEVMLKQMAEIETKETKEILRRKEVELRNKDDAAQALRHQMLEKQAQKDLNKQNDAHYANQVSMRINNIKNQEHDA